jgi:type IV pilus assembly protein PilN
MIKINLLRAEHQAAKKPAGFRFEHKIPVACGLILLAAAIVIGGRYLSLGKQSEQLDTDIVRAQNEAARLRTIIAQVQQFEQRSAQLQQRVSLIEQLRRDQTGPVHMLDQISRALPPMLWLTDLKQGANPDEVLIEGRCTTLTGLSDFVSNLEQSGYFRKSVEIVSTLSEAPGPTQRGELIKFSIKGIFQRPQNSGSGPPAPPPVGKPSVG